MKKCTFVVMAFLFSAHVYGAKGKTLHQVKKKGYLVCGVTSGREGFSAPDSKGTWKGFDVDICRAVSAAIFGDPNKVKYIPLSTQARFTAIQSGEVDILSRTTTWTLGRDTALGLNFAPTVFYDGQAFMVRKKDRVASVNELNGSSICAQSGTTTELNMADYFRSRQMKLKPVIFEDRDETTKAFLNGRCDALTMDKSALVSERSKLKHPDNYIILPDIISKEPLAPAVRHGDDQWFDIVKWSIHAMLQAEEYGIASSNVDKYLKSKSPDIKRFLGQTPGMGKNLGLNTKWAYDIVKKVGNYKEVFDRNVGMDSALKMKRGYNRLWNRGGLMYPLPIR